MKGKIEFRSRSPTSLTNGLTSEIVVGERVTIETRLATTCLWLGEESKYQTQFPIFIIKLG